MTLKRMSKLVYWDAFALWAGLVCTTVHYKPIVINIKQYMWITRSTRERQCHHMCKWVFILFCTFAYKSQEAGEEFDSRLCLVPHEGHPNITEL